LVLYINNHKAQHQAIMYHAQNGLTLLLSVPVCVVVGFVDVPRVVTGSGVERTVLSAVEGNSAVKMHSDS